MARHTNSHRYGFISRNDLNVFSEAMRLSIIVGATQFHWSEGTMRLRLTTSRWQLFRYLMFLNGIIFYGLFLLLNFVRLTAWEKQPLSKTVSILFVLMFISSLGLIQNLLIFKQRDIMDWFNGILQLDSLVGAFIKNGKTTSSKTYDRQVAYYIRFFIGTFRPGLLMWSFDCFLFALVFSRQQFFVIAILPEHYHHPILALLQAIVLAINIFISGTLMTTASQILLLGSIFLEYFYHEIGIGRLRYMTKADFRSPSTLTIFLRRWTLLVNDLNSWFRHFILPSQLLVTRTVQVCIFVMVRYHQDSGILVIIILFSYVLCCGGGILVLLGLAGYFNRLSSKALKTFRRIPVIRDMTRCEQKEWKIVTRSFQPVALRVGNFYCIKRNSVMKSMADYLRGSVRLLTVLRKQT